MSVADKDQLNPPYMAEPTSRPSRAGGSLSKRIIERSHSAFHPTTPRCRSLPRWECNSGRIQGAQPKDSQVRIPQVLRKKAARLTKTRSGRGTPRPQEQGFPESSRPLGPSADNSTHFSEGPAQHGPRAPSATTGTRWRGGKRKGQLPLLALHGRSHLWSSQNLSAPSSRIGQIAAQGKWSLHTIGWRR